MPPEPIIDDQDYASSEDSDFAPDDDDDAAPGADDNNNNNTSDDDDDDDDDNTERQAAAKRKRADADDDGFENSGDEAVIERGRKKKKQQQQQRRAQRDEGGEGGLIKTRSMRAVEKAERKVQVASGPVTIDVDALWASMTAAAPIAPPPPPAKEHQDGPTAAQQQQEQQETKAAETGETIKIKRTYKFAGKVHTEEKEVARDSAEARLYLATSTQQQGDSDVKDDDDKRPPPPRRAFRSAFEPVTGGGQQQQQRSDLDLGIAASLRRTNKTAAKINTVEKSRMDWAGFVDRAGIRDELALAGRAKGSFAERQGFLARSEARREEDARKVRMAGRA